MTNMCQELHCLPRQGGLYDQDFFDALKMQWVIAAQVKQRDKKKAK